MNPFFPYILGQVVMLMAAITYLLISTSRGLKPHFLPKDWEEYTTREKTSAYFDWLWPQWLVGALAMIALTSLVELKWLGFMAYLLMTAMIYHAIVGCWNLIRYGKWTYSVKEDFGVRGWNNLGRFLKTEMYTHFYAPRIPILLLSVILATITTDLLCKTLLRL